MIEDTATRCPFCRAEVNGPDGGRRPSGRPKPGLLIAVAIGVVLLAAVVAIVLLPSSDQHSDAATYREIAEIYQQHTSGGGDLKERLRRISDRLSETAGSSEHAQQEMLWAARDYLLPMLGSPPGSDTRSEETFKTHMAVARQLIGDPSLPDLGGKLPQPAAE
jgi:hypothetical protein